MKNQLLLFLFLQQAQELFGFTAVQTVISVPHNHINNKVYTGTSKKGSRLYAYETEIAYSTIAFASSHIAMSAIRNDLIDRIGDAAEPLVGTGWKLPDIWPGDEAGQEIFPTKDIAGRQLYRILYTFVSFTTLGAGFVYYLNALAEDQLSTLPTQEDVSIYYAIASLASGISLASLVNPSPLSLVPVYEQDVNTNGDRRSAPTIRRNDSKKLQAYGLTRITRHPLILPVVPWGVATAMIMGGHARDFWLFGILSVYAIAGCAAQDLRVIREEGSVGTVFDPDNSLREFFQETSFVPFQAVFESRQSVDDIVKEVPWWALVVGTVIGYQIQQAFISFLVGHVAG